MWRTPETYFCACIALTSKLIRIEGIRTSEQELSWCWQAKWHDIHEGLTEKTQAYSWHVYMISAEVRGEDRLSAQAGRQAGSPKMTNYRCLRSDETQTLASGCWDCFDFQEGDRHSRPRNELIASAPLFCLSPPHFPHIVFVILSFEELVFSVCLIFGCLLGLSLKLEIPPFRLFMTDVSISGNAYCSQ